MREYLVMDFEFSVYTKKVGKPRGFFSEVLEYGMVQFVPQKGVLATRQSFVQPKFFPKQAKDSQLFSMISEADLKSAVSYESMIKELAAFYKPKESYFVAWGEADWKVIKDACVRYDVPNPFVLEDYLDLSMEYKSFYNLSYRPSLKNALDEQQIVLDGIWHTALADAKNTAKLVEHMLSQGWQPNKSVNE